MSKKTVEVGLSFGVTSGIMTTLGLVVGLNAGTHEKAAVIGGILTIAVADSLSDAFGVHIVEESSTRMSEREIWESTLFTFLFKALFALTFVLPILIFELPTAVLLCVLWGMFLLILFNIHLAYREKKPALPIIVEHISITLLVLFFTKLVGDIINVLYG